MAKIYQLQFCCTCRKPIREEDSYTRWEKEIYCEPCFDEYLAIVEPLDLLKKRKTRKTIRNAEIFPFIQKILQLKERANC